MSVPQVVTFDCYGTLIDWRSGIADAFARAAEEVGATAARDEVLDAYMAVEHEVEAGAYRPYREVLAETARRIAARLGWTPKDGGAFLAESLPTWKPFADTNAALERLAAGGVTLGILSNVDDDLLAATRRHFHVEVPLIVTAAQVRSYKPGHAHFLVARDRIGGKTWVHAAQSHFHDVVPCRKLGIEVAWVNRLGEAPAGGVLPTLEVAELAGLARVLLET